MDSMSRTSFWALVIFCTLSIHHDTAKAATYSSICTQTPYPEMCHSLMNKNLFQLREISLRQTLTQAEQAQKLIAAMDMSSISKQAKSAWTDCVELYEDTIYQIDRSIAVGWKERTAADVQTWLSGAIANEQTCQNGFIDFNLSCNHFQAYPFSNLSKLLSNSLAINKALSSSYDQQLQSRNRRLLSHDERYFPRWVSRGDRGLLRSSGAWTKADIVVAKDGLGDFGTISEALAAAAKRTSNDGLRRFVVYVKKGVYEENVEVKRFMKNFMLIGDGIHQTVITGNKNAKNGYTTFRSATFAVTGDGFIARGITFENTADTANHQAVALRCGADFSVFYECTFAGYQDTLYVHSHRQFYRDCDIYGTVDFIFGDAAAVFQNCNIYIRKPVAGQINTVTAQGRKDPNENTGIVIHDSRITAAASGSGGGAVSLYRSYLGRPWHKYSRTVVMKCWIDGLIEPAGWLPWSGDFALSTLYYGEYMNSGGGARTGGRVKWPGFHVITSKDEARRFSVEQFLAGDTWIPATGVPFTPGL